MRTFIQKDLNLLILATFAILLTSTKCSITAEEQKAKDANCKFESYNQQTGNCDICLETFFNKAEGSIKKCFPCSYNCMICTNEINCTKCKQGDVQTKYTIKEITSENKQTCLTEALKTETNSQGSWFFGLSAMTSVFIFFCFLCCIVCLCAVIGGVGYYFVRAGQKAADYPTYYNNDNDGIVQPDNYQAYNSGF